MTAAIESVLQRIAAAGAENDRNEKEHRRKCLNLESETGQLVALLLRLFHARNVLEIGTSTGFSTVCIASALLDTGGRLTTIERDPEKQAHARHNIAEAGLSSCVDFRLGEATQVVAALSGPFDCIFFDADRITAPDQLALLLPKLNRPALLLADNALSHPDEIRTYLQRVDAIPGVSHLIVPIGKGLSVAHLT